MSKDETFVQILKVFEAAILILIGLSNLVLLNKIRILILRIIEILSKL